MTINTDRRTLTRGVMWTVPVIAVAATAPAFAASQDLVCAPTARCKNPGNPKDKSYVIDTNCSTQNGVIAKVEIQDKDGEWILAEPLPGGGWSAPGFNDSRRDRPVRITDSATPEPLVRVYNVSFSPC